MSFVAARELEEDARKYAGEAIRFDSQGAHGTAIQMYQKVISTLIKLVRLYPDYSLNRHYMDKAGIYQERVKAIQQGNGLLPQDTPAEGATFPVIAPSAGGNGSRGSQMVPQLKASFDELVV